MTQAFLGKGTQLQVEDPSNPGVYLTIPEVVTLSGPGLEESEVDVFNMDSPGRSLEYIAGPVDPGNVEFEVNYIPGNAVHALILSDMTALAQTKRNFRIRFSQVTPVRRWDFAGFFKSFGGQFNPDAAGRIRSAVRISGSITPVTE